jgi:arylsulfatase A-like enzyme
MGKWPTADGSRPGCARIVLALVLAIVFSAGLAGLHGMLEVFLTGASPARFLPVACIFYPIAGALTGLAAGTLVAGLQLFPIGRRLLRERPAPLLLGASVAMLYGSALLLEIVFRFLPHEISLPTIAAAGLAGLTLTGLTVIIGEFLPGRIATIFAAIFAVALVASVPIAFFGEPGAVRSTASNRPTPDPGSPNVVLILIDTLRADHLSSYGYERETSPRIDALAASGIRFENAYAQAAWTKPSVASLFTSRFVSEVSGPDIYREVPEEFPTIAEMLRDVGYRTAAFVANPVVNPTMSFHRGFDYFYYGYLDFAQLQLHRYFLWLDLTQAPQYSLRSDYLNARGLQWLETAAQQRSTPFFAYFQYMDPHEPYVAQERFQRMFASADEPVITTLPAPLPMRLPFDALPASAVAEGDRRSRIAGYDACIRQNDHAVGVLVDALRENGLWENTVLILVADHGEEFFEHGGWGHSHSLYEEVIRVPLIIRLPGNAYAGQVVIDNAMLVDVMATIAGLTGTTPPEGIQGRDLLTQPVETEGTNEGDGGEAFAELFGQPGTLRAVIANRWKQIRARRDDDERRLLFDLDADPSERRNLVDGTSAGMTAAGTEFEALAVADSLDVVAAIRLGDGEEGEASNQTELDDAVRRQLEELGYIIDE